MGYEQDRDLSETARPAPYLRLQPEAKQEVSWPHDRGHRFAGKSANIAKSMGSFQLGESRYEMI